MAGDLDPLDPTMEKNLASALISSAQFNQQTLERVNAMKFLVLKAFEGDEHGGGGRQSSGTGRHAQGYHNQDSLACRGPC